MLVCTRALSSAASRFTDLPLDDAQSYCGMCSMLILRACLPLMQIRRNEAVAPATASPLEPPHQAQRQQQQDLAG
jgi:hypothetical protein